MSALAIPRLTVEQYLNLERTLESRHEYLDGVMYAMAGGTPAHAALGLAIGAELRSALRGRGCTAYNGEIQIEVSSKGGPYFYADASVACESESSPILIVEVLSRSTEKFDRGVKFLEYQRLDSLREYVLISQNRSRVETWLRKDDGAWHQTIFSGLDAVARFESVDCSIPIANIYEGVNLEDA